MDSLTMKAKICLVGEAAVGKTSLIRRLVMDYFDDRYDQTLGTKVYKKEFDTSLPEMNVELAVHMMIWDIMGQSGFRDLLKEAYFQRAKGAVAVCDVTRRSSLESLHEWVRSVHGVAGEIPLVFVANKVDLKASGEFGKAEMMEASRTYNSPCFLSSAKTGENVEAVFQTMANNIAREQLMLKGELSALLGQTQL